jgi:hypothetical protein
MLIDIYFPLRRQDRHHHLPRKPGALVRVLAGSTLVVVVALLAGCTNADTGVAVAGSGSSSAIASAASSPSPVAGLPHHGAPAVTHPMEPTVFINEPCRLLTSAQAKQLGVDMPGRAREGSGGHDCSWTSTTGAAVGIQFDLLTPVGLSRTYEMRDSYAYFTEIPSIEGFPAVAAATVDARDLGDCEIWVGVNDKLVLLVTGSVSRAKAGQLDPCPATEISAGMMVKTMKGTG